MKERSAWRWWICGLLLLATMLNYMDRQVLSNTAPEVQRDLEISDVGYGQAEMAFGFTFAVGGFIVAYALDRGGSIRWIYAGVVLLWSAAGVATAAVGSFAGLLACRAWLGLAESMHWPCALKTTQRILPPEDRPLGNGLLQSGAALGAILTPQVLLALQGQRNWRLPFVVIGSAGMLWAFAWVGSFRGRAAGGSGPETGGAERNPQGERWSSILRDRRLWVVMALSALFNADWQFLRAWLPKLLRESRGYEYETTLNFISVYYLAADLGSIACGWLTGRLVRGGMPVERARARVMLAASLLPALAPVAVLLPSGYLFLGVLLVMAFGSLGIFPNFYSLTQEISSRHQAKITAMISLSCWLVVSPLQPLAGWVVEKFGKERGYAVNLIAGGFFPLAGMAVLYLFWPRAPQVDDASRSEIEP